MHTISLVFSLNCDVTLQFLLPFISTRVLMEGILANYALMQCKLILCIDCAWYVTKNAMFKKSSKTSYLLCLPNKTSMSGNFTLLCGLD